MTDFNAHLAKFKSTQRWPLIASADPGAEKGYALGDPHDLVVRGKFTSPRIVALGTKPTHISYVPPVNFGTREIWSITEFQYAGRVTDGEISAMNIIKLGFRAGYMLRDMQTFPCATFAFAAVPGQWKPEVFAGGDTIRKDIFCERLKRQLVPSELALFEKVPAANVDDVLDAIGINMALWLVMQRPGTLGAAHLEKWQVEPERIIPMNIPRKKRPAGA